MIYVDYICKLTHFNGLKNTFAVQNIFIVGFFLAYVSSSLFRHYNAHIEKICKLECDVIDLPFLGSQ